MKGLRFELSAGVLKSLFLRRASRYHRADPEAIRHVRLRSDGRR